MYTYSNQWMQSEIKSIYEKSGCDSPEEFAYKAEINKDEFSSLLNDINPAQPSMEVVRRICNMVLDVSSVEICESCGYPRNIWNENIH